MLPVASFHAYQVLLYTGMRTFPICVVGRKKPSPYGDTGMSKINPRYQNGALRRKNRARFRAMDAPCGICKGRLGAIHYDEPSDSNHPLSFVIDEIKPISRYKEFGYSSKREAAEDWNNLQAAHYICNQKKGAKVENRKYLVNISDGEWY